MAESDGREEGRTPDVLASQLRHFDCQIADLRQWYDSLVPSEREQFRAWLERVIIVASEGSQWGALLRVGTEYDVCDRDGNTLWWADAEFSPRTMLDAVKAWDAGEAFTPSSVLP